MSFLLRFSADFQDAKRKTRNLKEAIESPEFKEMLHYDFGLFSIKHAKGLCDSFGISDTGDFKRSINFLATTKFVIVHDGVSYGIMLEHGSRPHKVYLWGKSTKGKPRRLWNIHDLTGFGRYMKRKRKWSLSKLRKFWFLRPSTPAYHVFLNTQMALKDWAPSQINLRVSQIVKEAYA